MKTGDPTRSRVLLVLVFAAVVLVAVVAWNNSRLRRDAERAAQQAAHEAATQQTASPPHPPAPDPAVPLVHLTNQHVASATPEKPALSTNAVERLSQIREMFRSLANGDRTNAIRAAKLMTNANDREAALLALVTVWRQGVLSPPVQRAEAIASHGLEAGLGIELAKSDPSLAIAWANELTDGAGRTAVLQQAGRTLVMSDPYAAFALNAQVPVADQAGFTQGLFAAWASVDTDAALQWANQIPDPADRNAAIDAIHTTAPVGIGTALRMQDGYPVVSDLIPGGAAESSGQLHSGDRIVALAQGDSQFVNLQNLSLQDIVAAIRGQPNTVLQLQVIPAAADLGAPPITIAITRNQIKFKQ